MGLCTIRLREQVPKTHGSLCSSLGRIVYGTAGSLAFLEQAVVFTSPRTPQGLYDTCQFIDLVELSSMWIYDTW